MLLRSRHLPPAAGLSEWRAPQCPFTVEWLPAVLDEIRVAATDAFFSLPHGGVEIGGVLFGRRGGRRVRILAACPLKCQYAFGPTFTLSESDHAQLRDLLAGQRDLEPVGWYHSHTRTGVSLSPQDVEIYNRYFPRRWQVALVVKPHAMQPMCAGFFFRESGGALRAESSYREFDLLPVDLSPKSTACADVPLPRFLTNPPERRSSRWLWWRRVKSYPVDGELQIQLDGNAAPVAVAVSGVLKIADDAGKIIDLRLACRRSSS